MNKIMNWKQIKAMNEWKAEINWNRILELLSIVFWAPVVLKFNYFLMFFFMIYFILFSYFSLSSLSLVTKLIRGWSIFAFSRAVTTVPRSGARADCLCAPFCWTGMGHMGRCCAASRFVTGIILAMGPLRFRRGWGHANRAGDSALESRVDERHYSNRSQLGTTGDRLPKGLLHRPGSHLANKDVGPDEQAIMRPDFAGRSPVSAGHETCRSFSAGEGCWLDHKRRAQQTTRNCSWIRKTRFQQR